MKYEVCNIFVLFCCVNVVLGVWIKLFLKGDYNVFFLLVNFLVVFVSVYVLFNKEFN